MGCSIFSYFPFFQLDTFWEVGCAARVCVSVCVSKYVIAFTTPLPVFTLLLDSE